MLGEFSLSKYFEVCLCESAPHVSFCLYFFLFVPQVGGIKMNNQKRKRAVLIRTRSHEPDFMICRNVSYTTAQTPKLSYWLTNTRWLAMRNTAVLLLSVQVVESETRCPFVRKCARAHARSVRGGTGWRTAAGQCHPLQIAPCVRKCARN